MMIRICFAALLSVFAISTASGTEQGPAAWRPMIYSNLQTPTSANAAYAELWAAEIAENNSAYVAQGDMRYANINAPAIEAHIVVRSATKTAVLTILDTGTGCSVKSKDEITGAVIKLCPMITAIYEGAQVTVTRGRKACFVEMAGTNPSSDPSRVASYGSYDVGSKSFKIGTIINHEPVAGCSSVIPLYDRLVP